MAASREPSVLARLADGPALPEIAWVRLLEVEIWLRRS
jgi:hypothetical protein